MPIFKSDVSRVRVVRPEYLVDDHEEVVEATCFQSLANRYGSISFAKRVALHMGMRSGVAGTSRIGIDRFNAIDRSISLGATNLVDLDSDDELTQLYPFEHNRFGGNANSSQLVVDLDAAELTIQSK